MAVAEQSQEGLKAVYEEICRAHDGIAEFRAKLLALLPIASGAGIFLLLNKDTWQANEHFFAVGIFGALITVGLFLYELRGIQRCNALSNCGKSLEQELLGEKAHTGTFVGEPPAAFRVVGNTWAALVIYSTVIGAWTYVALVGVVPVGSMWLLVGAGVFVVVSIALGWVVVNRQDKMLEQRIKALSSNTALNTDAR